MSKIKLLILLLVLTLSFANLAKASASINDVHAGNVKEESVYTLSDAVYDEETGGLAYQKISYNKNTYETMTSEDMDATGAPVDVSNDAQYVFIPARYVHCTENTLVSFKYKNNGVQKIVLHAEYSAGISKGGVDYKAGYKLVCVNALPNGGWNVSTSKSVDGYDVVSILFGSYANEIHDFSLVGFRLYFDYGVQVNNSVREFEIFGCEVHETGTNPSFASDPKPTRMGKLTSEDVTIEGNKFTVGLYAEVQAKIRDYTPDNYKLNVNFNIDKDALMTFKLDGKTIYDDMYAAGDHSLTFLLTEENYELLEISVMGMNVTVTVKSMEFFSKPYVDEFSGSSQFSITKTAEGTVVKYSYKNGYYSLKGAVRKYNEDYDYLKFNFNLSKPVVVGILIDGAYVRSHWDLPDPLAAGDHELLFDITQFDIDSSSTIEIYLDAPVKATTGYDGETVVTFTSVEFVNSDDFPKANIKVDPLFEFDYDGKEHAATGATTDSGAELIYEYKLEGTSDEYYSDAAPVDAGTYTVRITSPLHGTFGKTYAYSKVVINKLESSTPSSSVISVDYANSRVIYDEDLYLVALDEAFTNVVRSGSYVVAETKLYYKQIETTNYLESASSSLTLAGKTSKPTVSLDSTGLKTLEVISEDVEYSVDGIHWTSGTGAVVELEDGYIYLFRTKATSSNFASDVTYLEVGSKKEVETKTLPEEEITVSEITYTYASGEEYSYEYVVTNYAELYKALEKTSNNYRTNIIVKGKVSIDYDLTIKGKVTFTGTEGAELVFEKDGKTRKLINSKNSEIKFVNITLSRTVVPTTETYAIYFKENGQAWFTDVVFNMAANESLGNGDRIVYMSSGTKATLYFNHCTFNTAGYFYRCTMYFYNCDMVPKNANASVYNFNELVLDYENQKITFPSTYKVSEDAEFGKLIKSGSTLKSLTTYYVAKGDVVLTFTTKNMKLQTPTLDSVSIDYNNEKIYFNESYLVSKDSSFTELVNSGDSIVPGMKLYIKQLGIGAYLDSDVFETTLPQRASAVELKSAFVGSFGFVMESYPNAIYAINGEYQLSPVFVNLESNTKYVVTVKVAATNSSFASETYQVEVTTK